MPDDRLTALDASFLSLEDAGNAHMHVAGVLIFEGPMPLYEEVLRAVRRRLHMVPRYRQKVCPVPLSLNTPQWVDDPYFNLEYHVRLTALPAPGTEEQLKALAGRVLSQRLDRSRPLWEMWLVEGLEGSRWAIVDKAHHALVDGISGVDIVTVLFDMERHPVDEVSPPRPWHARPLPSPARTVASALRDRAGSQMLALRSGLALAGHPRAVARLAGAVLGTVTNVGASWALRPAPPSIYTAPIGPHRRFTWVRSSLAGLKEVKNALGGTVNDVVLAVVTGALRRHMLRRGEPVDGVELVAMVPVSMRTDPERGALGNRVSTVFARLPVGEADPVRRLQHLSDDMRELKESGQAMGAEMITKIGGLAPSTLMAQAARLISSTRVFTITITNVPGPQVPLYLLGRRLLEFFPMVPLADDHALGVAVISYDGAVHFGLVGDWDAMEDLEQVAADVIAALDELREHAGAEPATPARRAAAGAPRVPRQGRRRGLGSRAGARRR